MSSSRSAAAIFKKRAGDKFWELSYLPSDDLDYWKEVNKVKEAIISAIQSTSFPDPSPDPSPDPGCHFKFKEEEYSIIKGPGGELYVRRRKAYETGDPILSSGARSKVDIGIMVPKGWIQAKGNKGLQMFSINKHHKRRDSVSTGSRRCTRKGFRRLTIEETSALEKDINQKVQELGIGLDTTTIIREKTTNGTTVTKVYEIQPLGQDLFTCLHKDKLSQEQKHSIAAQLAIIMDKMQSNNLFHRDLKPANIMIMWDGGKPTVKLIDFDFAAIGENSLAIPDVGTPDYLPAGFNGEDCPWLLYATSSNLALYDINKYALLDKFAFTRVLGDMDIGDGVGCPKPTAKRSNSSEPTSIEFMTIPHEDIFKPSNNPFKRIAVKYIFSELKIGKDIFSIDRRIVFAILALYDAGIRDKENIEGLLGDGADAKVKAINTLNDAGIADNENIKKLLGDGADAKAKVSAINTLADTKEFLIQTIARLSESSVSDAWRFSLFSCCGTRKKPRLKSLLSDINTAKFKSVLDVGTDTDISITVGSVRDALAIRRNIVHYNTPKSLTEFDRTFTSTS